MTFRRIRAGEASPASCNGTDSGCRSRYMRSIWNPMNFRSCGENWGFSWIRRMRSTCFRWWNAVAIVAFGGSDRRALVARFVCYRKLTGLEWPPMHPPVASFRRPPRRPPAPDSSMTSVVVDDCSHSARLRPSALASRRSANNSAFHSSSLSFPWRASPCSHSPTVSPARCTACRCSPPPGTTAWPAR